MRYQGNIMGAATAWPNQNMMQNEPRGRTRKEAGRSQGNPAVYNQQNPPFMGGNIDALPNRSPPRNNQQQNQ